MLDEFFLEMTKAEFSFVYRPEEGNGLYSVHREINAIRTENVSWLLILVDSEVY